MRLSEMIYTEEEMQELREENRKLKKSVEYRKDKANKNREVAEWFDKLKKMP